MNNYYSVCVYCFVIIQVLSNSVAEALKRSNDPALEKTIEFVQMFDRFFDCLNVSALDAGKHSRNPFKNPYHSAKDFRIKVCT
jgi:hypothetical protein